MKTKLNVAATHEGKPVTIEIEVDMTPKEFIIYITKVVPLIKKVLKMQKEQGEL